MEEIKHWKDVFRNSTSLSAIIGAVTLVVVTVLTITFSRGGSPEEIAEVIRQMDLHNELIRDKESSEARISQLENKLNSQLQITVMKPDIQATKEEQQRLDEERRSSEREREELLTEINQLREYSFNITKELNRLNMLEPQVSNQAEQNTEQASVELTKASIVMCTTHNLRNIEAEYRTSGLLRPGYEVQFHVSHSDGTLHGKFVRTKLNGDGVFKVTLDHKNIDLESCINKRHLFLEAEVVELGGGVIAKALPVLLNDNHLGNPPRKLR